MICLHLHLFEMEGNERTGSQVLAKRNNDHIVRLDADRFDHLFVCAVGKNAFVEKSLIF